jgi:hypothetical protein
MYVFMDGWMDGWTRRWCDRMEEILLYVWRSSHKIKVNSLPWNLENFIRLSINKRL